MAASLQFTETRVRASDRVTSLCTIVSISYEWETDYNLLSLRYDYKFMHGFILSCEMRGILLVCMFFICRFFFALAFIWWKKIQKNTMSKQN